MYTQFSGPGRPKGSSWEYTKLEWHFYLSFRVHRGTITLTLAKGMNLKILELPMGRGFSMGPATMTLQYATKVLQRLDKLVHRKNTRRLQIDFTLLSWNFLPLYRPDILPVLLNTISNYATEWVLENEKVNRACPSPFRAQSAA